MDLSVRNCQTIVRHHYDSMNVKEKKQDKKLAHALRVLALCQDISARLPQELQAVLHPELLAAAAVLHDIAKFDSDRLHHLQAIDVIRAGLNPNPENEDDEAILSALDQVILAHKDGFNPSPAYAADAAILRMADKIDQVRRKTRKSAEAQADIEEAEEKIARAEAKLKEAKEGGNLEKLRDKKQKLKEKERKLEDKEAKLAKETRDLQDAEAHFQGSLEKVTAFSQGNSCGSCTPALAQALASICSSLKDGSLSPAVNS